MSSEHESSLHKVPSNKVLADIAAKQDARAEEIRARRAAQTQTAQEEAAGVIQRHYRGYRQRRQLKGMSLDPSLRWTDALKEAQYRNLTKPTSRTERDGTLSRKGSEDISHSSSGARRSWKRVGQVARRAGADDCSDNEEKEGMTQEHREGYQQRKDKAQRARANTEQTMDLNYFLEMVDAKHRHGANLRRYHSEWRDSNTHENFFYWLDRGEGRSADLPERSRARLERERVRYLSREEKRHYLVNVDTEGRLCWGKNGARISTTVDWRDSINGIVALDDDTPPYRAVGGEDSMLLVSSTAESTSSSSDASSVSSGHSTRNDPGPPKSGKNLWIFVADSSHRLYVGIKQKGTFQHSSFLHGSKISAAGQIKVKNGQLRKLSPLSGHYRPPISSFRAFVRSLKEQGVDMSRVSIPESYAVILGLEGYIKTKKAAKSAMQRMAEQKDKLLHPEEAKAREEAAQDHSKSAQREREIMTAEAAKEEQEKHKGLSTQIFSKLNLRP